MYGTTYLQNRMISAVLLVLHVLLKAQTYHNFYRSDTNRSRFLVVFNILGYFVHWRLLVPFGLGVLLLCCSRFCVFNYCILSSYMYTQGVLNE